MTMLPLSYFRKPSMHSRDVVFPAPFMPSRAKAGAIPGKCNHYNFVVLKKKLRYNINVVRYLFIDDYILCKKEKDCEHRIEKCGKNNG